MLILQKVLAWGRAILFIRKGPLIKTLQTIVNTVEECMLCETKSDVLKLVKEKNISFVQFWFTDVLGILKSFAVTPSELEEGLEEGMGFDGSSIEGFARIEESDMIAMPDPSTFQFLPWRPHERPVGRLFCDILKPDGNPYEGDSRYVLKKMQKKLAAKGYKAYMGPELEFFLFWEHG